MNLKALGPWWLVPFGAALGGGLALEDKLPVYGWTYDLILGGGNVAGTALAGAVVAGIAAVVLMGPRVKR